MVECLDAGLQEHGCPALSPWPRLFLDKAFAEHRVDRRLHKRRRNRLAVPLPLPRVRNEAAIVLDIRAELPQGSFEAWAARGGVGQVVNALVELAEAPQRLLHLPGPQAPLHTPQLLLDTCSYLLT